MTIQKRRILWLILAFLFLVATPPLLLYAKGYRLDFEQRKIKEVGGMYIKSIPRKARISINSKYRDDTPTFLRNLTPEEYYIEVAKEGYHVWRKKLIVEPGIVTEVRNIFLFPQNPSKEKITQEDAKTIFPQNSLNSKKTPSEVLKSIDAKNIQADYFDDDKYFALTKNGFVFFLNPETKSLDQLNPAPIDTARAESFRIAKNKSKILYWNKHEIYVYYLKDILIQPFKKKGDVELLTRRQNTIAKADFLPKNSQYIVFETQGKIKALELDNRDIRNVVDVYRAKGSLDDWKFSEKESTLYVREGANYYKVKIEL